MNLKRFKEHGYSIILGRDGENVEYGFGYGDGTENNGCAPCLNFGLEKVLTQAETWEATMGRKYNVYVIKEDTAQLVTRESIMADLAAIDAITATGFKVEVVETYQWSHAKLRGMTITKNGERLKGMITVDVNDLARSLEQDLRRYMTEYSWIEYVGEGADFSKKQKIFHGPGPWADLTPDEVQNLRIEILSTVF